MLFSNATVAAYINNNFEPAWQSVRPVPTVKIDFGNGHTITRTLHGNVATYLCSTDGKVLDIIAGVYDPEAYLLRLADYSLLADYDQQSGADREKRIKDYHQQQAQSLRQHGRPQILTKVSRGPSISVREVGVKITLQPARRIRTRRAVATDGKATDRLRPRDPDSAADLVGWKALAEDTRINETVRRQAIHVKLADVGLIPPEKLTKWLYREVLHADLDDPYMGLGKILFPEGKPSSPTAH